MKKYPDDIVHKWHNNTHKEIAISLLCCYMSLYVTNNGETFSSSAPRNNTINIGISVLLYTASLYGLHMANAVMYRPKLTDNINMEMNGSLVKANATAKARPSMS